MSELNESGESGGANKRPPLVLQSGIIVLCNTEVRGGVTYETEELTVSEKEKEAKATTDVAAVEKKLSFKVTDDPKEHEKALSVRNKARRKVEDVCARLPFGLLCQKKDEEKLDEAIVEAEAMVREFNKTAKHTRVEIWPMKTLLVDGDQEKAMKSVANEIARTIGEMKKGVEARDPDAIRAAIRKAKMVSAMIDDMAQTRVSAALDIAKSAAKEIAKTIETRGHADLMLVADTNKKILDEVQASFTMLDLEAPAAVASTVPVATVSEIDVPVAECEAAPTAVPVVAPPAEGELDVEPVASAAAEADPIPTPDDVDASRAVDADAKAYAAESESESESRTGESADPIEF